MKNTSYLKIFLLILLFSNSIYAQSNYITLNTLLGDKSNRLLNSNNFGKNIQRQNLDLSISKEFSLPKNQNYKVELYSSLSDSRGLHFYQLGFKISKKEKYFFSIGKIVDGNFYLPKNTSGSMLFSNNYEPIPEIKLGMDNIKISKKLRFSALFSNGILDKNDDFYERPYLHHKYLFFDLGNFEEKKYFSFGLHHAAVWGGATTIYNYGDLGRTLEDLYYVVFAKHGNSVNINGPQGNHLGILHFSYRFTKKYDNYIYYQKFWEDGNSLNKYYGPIWDGLYGYNYKDENMSITIEYLKTTFQSGNIHPPGIDSFYWHIPYTFGWEYKNYTIGNFQISKDSNRVESIYLDYSKKLNEKFELSLILNVINRYSISYQDKGWNEEIDLSTDSYITYKMAKVRLDFQDKRKSHLSYFIDSGLDIFLKEKNIACNVGVTYSFNFLP